jgi:hypothetical protein
MANFRELTLSIATMSLTAGSIIVRLRLLPGPNGDSVPPVALAQALAEQVANTSSRLRMSGAITNSTVSGSLVVGGFCAALPCGKGTCEDSFTGYKCSCDKRYGLLLRVADCELGKAAAALELGAAVCCNILPIDPDFVACTDWPIISLIGGVVLIGVLLAGMLYIRTRSSANERSMMERISLFTVTLFPAVSAPAGLVLAVLVALELGQMTNDQAPGGNAIVLVVSFSASIVLPALVNTVALWMWVQKALRQPDFHSYFAQNRFGSSCICDVNELIRMTCSCARSWFAVPVLVVATLTDVTVVDVIGSGLFELECLRAPLRRNALADLSVWALPALAVGEVPRLIIQFLVRHHSGRSTTALALLVVSVLRVWHTILSRGVFRLLRQLKPSLFVTDPNRGAPLPPGVELAVRQVNALPAYRDRLVHACARVCRS